MEKCFNIHCDDHNAEAENGCRFSFVNPNICFGFVNKETWRKEMEDNKKEPKLHGFPNTSRISARDVLLDKIRRCKEELRALQILEESIEWDDLLAANEELLWNYFLSH